MPVRNRLKDVVKERDNIELTQYRIERDTGLGAGTARKLLDENYIPGGRTLQTVCSTYDLDPGDFLIREPD